MEGASERVSEWAYRCVDKMTTRTDHCYLAQHGDAELSPKETKETFYLERPILKGARLGERCCEREAGPFAVSVKPASAAFLDSTYKKACAKTVSREMRSAGTEFTVGSLHGASHLGLSAVLSN